MHTWKEQSKVKKKLDALRDQHQNENGEKKNQRDHIQRIFRRTFTNNYYFEKKKLQTARVKDIDAVCSGNKFKLDMLFFLL